MNEFLKALQRGLVGMDAQQIEEILEDYREHFSIGFEAGKTQDQIAAALGDPAQLAKMHKLMNASKRAHVSRKLGDMVRLIGAAVRYKAGGGVLVAALYFSCIVTLFLLYISAGVLVLGGFGGFVLMVMQISAGHIIYGVLSFFAMLIIGAGGLLLLRFTAWLWRYTFLSLPLMAHRLMRLDTKENEL